MTDASVSDDREATGVWLIHLTGGGVHGWSLWFSGDTDLVLSRQARVPLYASPETLRAALEAEPSAFMPSAAARLHGESLGRVLASPAVHCDLDAASVWLASPDRHADMRSCEAVLNAINMANDIGASVGDGQLATLFASDSLDGAYDALTLGQTLLGDGTPYHNDPAAMASAITSEAADTAVRLLTLASSHIDAA